MVVSFLQKIIAVFWHFIKHQTKTIYVTKWISSTWRMVISWTCVKKPIDLHCFLSYDLWTHYHIFQRGILSYEQHKKKKIDSHLYDLYVYIYVYHGADRSTCSLDYRVFFIIIKCHELSYQAGIWNYYLCSALLLLFKSKNMLLNYFFPLSTVCQHELQCFIKQWKVNGKNLWHEVYSVSKWLRYDE